MKKLEEAVVAMLDGIDVLRDKIQELERENRELKQKINELKLQADKNERDLEWLDCLRKAGVDNWNGYDYAQKLFSEHYPEED